ncbi:MAG: hypothetical protein FWF24_07550 [Alphaproteobacteria bacterium]|nr:hypothetical protein [Alphaproteobacteria bacterium]
MLGTRLIETTRSMQAFGAGAQYTKASRCRPMIPNCAMWLQSLTGAVWLRGATHWVKSGAGLTICSFISPLSVSDMSFQKQPICPKQVPFIKGSKKTQKKLQIFFRNMICLSNALKETGSLKKTSLLQKIIILLSYLKKKKGFLSSKGLLKNIEASLCKEKSLKIFELRFGEILSFKICNAHVKDGIFIVKQWGVRP